MRLILLPIKNRNYFCNNLYYLAFSITIYTLSYLLDYSLIVLIVFKTLTLTVYIANSNKYYNLAIFYYVT
jgi:hypothetical protein